MASLGSTKSCNTQHNSEHNSVVDSQGFIRQQLKKNWNTRTCKHGMKTYKTYMTLIKSALLFFCQESLYCISILQIVSQMKYKFTKSTYI